MKSIVGGRNIIVNLLVNMLLNFRWTIPAWIVLAAHFIFRFPPLWVFFAVLAIWPLKCLFFTVILRLISWISSTPSPARVQSGGTRLTRVKTDAPSVNPYSATAQKEAENRRIYGGVTGGEDYYAKYLSSQSGEEQAGIPDATPQAEDRSGVDEDGKKWVTIYGTDLTSQDE